MEPKMTHAEVAKLVADSMMGTMNFYASKNEMTAAVAVDDAYLVLNEVLQKAYAEKE